MDEMLLDMLGAYKTYALVVCLIVIFIKQPSISFFLDLILRLFRINYTDKQYLEYDKRIYNQQLFRLKRGVRTVCAEDAKLISDALSDGTIERADLRFTSFFGPVGVKRTIRHEFVSMIFFGLLFIGTALSIIYDAPYMKAGYVTYNADSGEKLYISKYRVYDKENNISYNKLDCMKIIKDTEAVQKLKDACTYITSQDQDVRAELYDAIKSESNAKKIIFTLVVLLMGFGWWLIIGFRNFVKLNKLVCDIKEKVVIKY